MTAPILNGLRPKTLRRVNAARGGTYDVVLILDTDRIAPSLLTMLGARRALLVTTPTVARLHGDVLYEQLRNLGGNVSLMVIPAREPTKRMNHVEAICLKSRELGLGRRDVLIALGGGVCTDLVTMAASLYRRGVPYVRIPTTLLGQIDGGIGIKGAVNFHDKKNLLGCFHPPQRVFIAPRYLSTLPELHLSSGLAETLKAAVVCDARLFSLVEQHAADLIASGFQRPAPEATEIIRLAIDIMLEELETNIYENRSLKRLMDFGHTFSPALEAASGFRFTHGEAVALDMCVSTVLAAELGVLAESDRDRIIDAVAACGLQVSTALLDLDLSRRSLHEAELHRGGKLNLVVPSRVGEGTYLDRIPEEAIARALLWLQARSGRGSIEVLGPPACLVYDIGGTHVRAGRYDPRSGRLTEYVRVRTPERSGDHEQQKAALLDVIRDAGRRVSDGAAFDRVGVAFAGPVSEEGVILSAPTIFGPVPGRALEDLSHELTSAWPRTQVQILNDVTAAGYRFLTRPDEDFCVITVGSGIGSKIFLLGRPSLGTGGWGGELGHLRIDDSLDAPFCDCGERGHLGGIASGRGALALAHRVRASDPSTLTSEDLARAFHDEVPWAVSVIRTAAGSLGRVMATLHLGLALPRFVVYGGFAGALGEPYRLLLVEAAQAASWRTGDDWSRMVELAPNDDLSGLIGTGRYLHEFQQHG